jgi:VanZ family protein
MGRGLARTLLPWLPVVVWMAAIFLVSGRIGNSDNSRSLLEGWLGLSGLWLHVINAVARKGFHLIEYAVLAALGFWALRRAHGLSPGWALVGGFLIAAAYACTDELHQAGVPGRKGQIGDVLTDAVGAAVGTYLPFRRSHPATSRAAAEE